MLEVYESDGHGGFFSLPPAWFEPRRLTRRGRTLPDGKTGPLPCLMGCLYESWFAATSRQLPGGEGFF